MNLYKCLYQAGVRVRNNKIPECYRYLKQTEKYDLQALHEIQLSRLQWLVMHANENCSYYREKFHSCGLDPLAIKTLEDLSKIPSTTKQELLANRDGIQLRHCGEKMFLSETSGSTGSPLVFHRNQEWDAWHNASVLRGYSWHNVAPWERNGYLWGYNTAPSKRWKVRMLDFLQNRFRLFSYRDDDVEQFARKLEEAAYLEGYSSMIYEVARKLNAAGIRYDSLKMVKGTSEKILDIYHAEAEKAFGRRIISEYGSAEAGIIAFECPFGNMHANMETAIIEEIDNEIVVTNLVSKSFPVIRYRLGDYIRIDTASRCDCGMAHQIIAEVSGRVGALIYGKKNSYPSLTLYYVFKNLALEKKVVFNYQAVQETKGKVVVHIEGTVGSSEASAISGEFTKYFSDDLEVTIVDNFRRTDFSRKRRDFISNLS